MEGPKLEAAILGPSPSSTSRIPIKPPRPVGLFSCGDTTRPVERPLSSTPMCRLHQWDFWLPRQRATEEIVPMAVGTADSPRFMAIGVTWDSFYFSRAPRAPARPNIGGFIKAGASFRSSDHFVHSAFSRCGPSESTKATAFGVLGLFHSAATGVCVCEQLGFLTHVPIDHTPSSVNLEFGHDLSLPPQPQCRPNRRFSRAKGTCLEVLLETSGVSFPTLLGCDSPIRSITIMIVSIDEPRPLGRYH